MRNLGLALLAVYFVSSAAVAEQQCKISGRFYTSVSMPADTRFLVYVYLGKDSKPEPGKHIGRIVTITDEIKSFEDYVAVPDGTEWLTIYYQLVQGPPVRIKEEYDNREPAASISGLFAMVISKFDNSVSLRTKAASLAHRDLEAAMQVFDEAVRIGDGPAQKLEAVRLKARTVAMTAGESDRALAEISKGTAIEGFDLLAENVKRGYWKERLDYFEKATFANGYGRDKNGSFAVAIINEPKLAQEWKSLTSDLEKAPPNDALVFSLTGLPTISKQDRAAKAVIYGEGLSSKQQLAKLESSGVQAVLLSPSQISMAREESREVAELKLQLKLARQKVPTAISESPKFFAEALRSVGLPASEPVNRAQYLEAIHGLTDREKLKDLIKYFESKSILVNPQ